MRKYQQQRGQEARQALELFWATMIFCVAIEAGLTAAHFANAWFA